MSTKQISVGQAVRVPLRKGTTIGTVSRVDGDRVTVSYLGTFNLRTGQFVSSRVTVSVDEVEIYEPKEK